MLFRSICKAANDLGVKYLTLYAFSTENWNRPESEVAALMKLLESYLKNCIKTANKNNMRVRVIGEISRLSENFQEKIRNLEEVSSVNTGLNLTIAINYGSRDEMIRAVKHMIADHDDGKLSSDDIDADTFSSSVKLVLILFLMHIINNYYLCVLAEFPIALLTFS